MKRYISKTAARVTKRLEGTGIGRVKPLFVVYKYFLRITKPDFVTTEGSRMKLDVDDSLLLSVYPNFEPHLTKVLKKVIKPGMTVIDGGAHIGYFTLLFARLVGERGRVFAFEPSAENFEILKENVLINGYNNVTLVNAALSKNNKPGKLYISAENTQDHRLLMKKSEKRKYKKVKCFSIDSYFRNVKKIDFIKLDTQGYEPWVIAGAKRTLKRNKKIRMVFEFWPYMNKEITKNPLTYIKFLESFGAVKVIDGRGRIVKPKTLETDKDKFMDENYIKEVYFEKTR